MVAWLAWDSASHKVRMDAAQDLKDELSDALSARSVAAAAPLAGKLIDFSREEEQLWEASKLDDGINLARKNREAAEAIVKALAAADFSQAQAAFGRLEQTCRACHDLHLEKRTR